MRASGRLPGQPSESPFVPRAFFHACQHVIGRRTAPLDQSSNSLRMEWWHGLRDGDSSNKRFGTAFYNSSTLQNR
ncbi:hypothetical protein [Haladaptatus sp. DFWS20]|uniref:hypothetical protein n=1 Tax=Haladaptatus sp. DFWS20 TaxID=3403467 RepID=UPI003EB98224